MFNDLKQAFSKNKTIAGIIATIFGFISDVCQPLAPFAKYLFFISLVALIVLAIAYLLKIARAKILPALVFVVMATFVLGVMYGLQSKQDNNNGFLANQIPALEKLQESMGIIEKDLKDIKQTTADIKQDTSEIKSKIDDMADSAFKQGGIISNPQTAEEFYHNAWLFEKNGDYGNARKAYVKYFSFNTDKLDPHINFQKFLKIQEGLAGAREIYNEMFDESNLVNKYAKILLENKEQKLAKLQTFATENPNFAPVFYELAKMYSPSANAEQSIDDKKNEKEYIDKFLKLNEQGKLVKYFIDKTELDEWIKYANERKMQLSKIDESDFVNPVSFGLRQCSRDSNNKALIKCYIFINIADKAKEIWYRTDKDTDFTSTGKFTVRYDDGLEKPSNIINNLTYTNSLQYIEIKYSDFNGNTKTTKLEWDKTLPNGKILDGFAVVQIESAQGQSASMLEKIEAKEKDGCNISFDGLYFWEGIEKLIYSINSDKLNKEYIPNANKNRDYDSIKVESYKANSKIYFQYHFKDGSKSKVFEKTLSNACEGKIK